MGNVSRQPGIYFDTVSPAPASNLPRMDIAGFVGFASNGPLHIPVLIEDMAHFRDVFGEDIALAWDAQLKRMQYSLLGSTLEVFFRNGGLRCWVVRVADDNKDNLNNAAQSARFEIPGLYQAGDLLAASIRARSAGGWAKNLQLSARLSVQSLAVAKAALNSSPNSEILSKTDDYYQLQVRSVPANLVAGDLVELRCGADSLRAYLFVDNIEVGESAQLLLAKEVYWFDRAEVDSPPLSSPDNPAENSATQEMPVPLDEISGMQRYENFINNSPEQVPAIRWLRFDLLVWQGDALQSQINGLRFHYQHPRYWGRLPDDQLLYAELVHRNPVSLQPGMASLLEEISYPRFALAADFYNDKNPPSSPASENVFLPLTMASSSLAKNVATAEYDEFSPSVNNVNRDGLDIFSADLFLDTDLAGLSVSSLITEANYQRFNVGRSLKGIHSLLAIDEISMLAVPDMLHRHWDTNSPAFDYALPAPELDQISPADEHGRRQLNWTAVDNTRRYIVQQSLSSEFEDFSEYVNEKPDPLILDNDDNPPAAESEIKLFFTQDNCTRYYYFRVRAEDYGQFSSWSNTRVLRLPASIFSDCEKADASLLGLRLIYDSAASNANEIAFIWEAEDAQSQALILADEYQLQRSTDKGFIAAKTIYPAENNIKDLTEFSTPLLSDSVVYFRVRAKSGEVSGPWSNTLEIHPKWLSKLSLNGIDEYNDEDFKAVQFALIRMCAAKADTLAILSLPAHYQAAQVAAAIDDIKPGYKTASQNVSGFGSGNLHVMSLNISEQSALSYAALYYPWFRITANNSSSNTDSAIKLNKNIQLIPPVGAVCGKLAATANLRGAWIASENKTLQSVLGLGVSFTDQNMFNLMNKQLNIIVSSPRGFVVSSGNTLSQSKDLKALNVRRLLLLLRRLAMREGNIYTFEPMSADFRNRVQHYWDTLLNDLYQRGAFLGRSAGAAYRVVTDESVNNQRSLEQGQFIIELRVSPSQPLSFLHIRLTQNGSDQLLFQEL